MDMNEAVAKALSAERAVAGLTVRELAALAQIPERSLMRILQAERDIKVNQVDLLARALRLYPHEIIEHAETILQRANRTSPTLTKVTRVEVGETTASPSEAEPSVTGARERFNQVLQKHGLEGQVAARGGVADQLSDDLMDELVTLIEGAHNELDEEPG